MSTSSNTANLLPPSSPVAPPGGFNVDDVFSDKNRNTGWDNQPIDQEREELSRKRTEEFTQLEWRFQRDFQGLANAKKQLEQKHLEQDKAAAADKQKQQPENEQKKDDTEQQLPYTASGSSSSNPADLANDAASGSKSGSGGDTGKQQEQQQQEQQEKKDDTEQQLPYTTSGSSSSNPADLANGAASGSGSGSGEGNGNQQEQQQGNNNKQNVDSAQLNGDTEPNQSFRQAAQFGGGNNKGKKAEHARSPGITARISEASKINRENVFANIPRFNAPVMGRKALPTGDRPPSAEASARTATAAAGAAAAAAAAFQSGVAHGSQAPPVPQANSSAPPLQSVRFGQGAPPPSPAPRQTPNQHGGANLGNPGTPPVPFNSAGRGIDIRQQAHSPLPVPAPRGYAQPGQGFYANLGNYQPPPVPASPGLPGAPHVADQRAFFHAPAAHQPGPPYPEYAPYYGNHLPPPPPPPPPAGGYPGYGGPGHFHMRAYGYAPYGGYIPAMEHWQYRQSKEREAAEIEAAYRATLQEERISRAKAMTQATMGAIFPYTRAYGYY